MVWKDEENWQIKSKRERETKRQQKAIQQERKTKEKITLVYDK